MEFTFNWWQLLLYVIAVQFVSWSFIKGFFFLKDKYLSKKRSSAYAEVKGITWRCKREECNFSVTAGSDYLIAQTQQLHALYHTPYDKI